MKAKKQEEFYKLIHRYKKFLYLGAGIFLASILLALAILYYCTEEENPVWYRLAEFLMAMSETMLGAGIIGGGIGGGINFIFEEMKNKEEAAKERRKTALENREKYQSFRRHIRRVLGEVHDNVGLARILIKSHKSGRTYGEQIRNRIMPSVVALQDIRRDLGNVEEGALKHNLLALRVSLNYMVAYLSILTREFESNYLAISNLQSYQDAMVDRMRGLFTNLAAKNNDQPGIEVDDQLLIGQAAAFFDKTDVPEKIDTVWQAIRELDYVRDFIDELRDNKGSRSDYSLFFLKHYNHCIRILRSASSGVNQKIVATPVFVDHMAELKRIDEKQRSDNPLTSSDMLTWQMMERELAFDIKLGRKKKKE